MSRYDDDGIEFAQQTFESARAYKESQAKKQDRFEEFKRIKHKFLAKDKKNRLVYFADSAFSLQMSKEKFPSILFHNTSEFS